MKTAIDIEDAKLDPSGTFKSPNEVLKHSGLSRDDKRRVLEQWKLDAQRLEESANENMAGGEASRLGEVNRALVELGQKA